MKVNCLLTLPDVESYKPSGTGESPLATIDEWVNTVDKETGRKARRETNTMPQWAGSCWYYLRYLDPDNEKTFCDIEKEKYWMPLIFISAELNMQFCILFMQDSGIKYYMILDMFLMKSRSENCLIRE